MTDTSAETSGSPAAPLASDGVGTSLRLGIVTMVVLLAGIGVWASTVSLTGAVVTAGTVVVEGNVRKVQHPTGGVVGDIRVRDGDRVKAGDLLLRLDDTITRANLQIVVGQLDEIEVRRARLVAERDEAAGLTVPPSLAARMAEAALHAYVASEQALFESRHKARAGQKAQLAERVVQLRQEIIGLEGQQKAKGDEIDLIGKELVGLYDLQKKKLVQSLKVTSLERESARLGGERAHLIAAIAQSRGKIAEIELQSIQIDQELKSEVMRELRDIQSKQAELNERRVAAEDQLRRIDLRAPVDGVVHQLAVHTIGGVIGTSEQIMLIVPEGDALVVDVKIAPQDIDQIRPGATAHVRFPAFNQRTTPELTGSLVRVSADLTREPQGNQSHYLARIALAEAELARLGALRLVPGMPAEVHIATGERTLMSYLMRPLADQFARAFRER